jgi:hypothetical protein
VEFVHYKTKIFSLTTAHGDRYSIQLFTNYKDETVVFTIFISICNMKARTSCKKSLKKTKGVIRSRKSGKKDKGANNDLQIKPLHRKLKIEQSKPH